MEAISPILNIVDLIKHREREAFNLLYKQYAPVILGMSLRLVKNASAAEDLVQETFVKVWKNIGQYDQQKASFSTWLLNIARYTTIDYLRSKQNKQLQKNQQVENSEYLIKDHSVSVNEDIIGIKGLVSKLERKYQDVIDLIYFGGYTQEEAAEILDIPLGTVKTRTRFAIQTLRSLIKK